MRGQVPSCQVLVRLETSTVSMNHWTSHIYFHSKNKSGCSHNKIKQQQQQFLQAHTNTCQFTTICTVSWKDRFPHWSLLPHHLPSSVLSSLHLFFITHCFLLFFLYFPSVSLFYFSVFFSHLCVACSLFHFTQVLFFFWSSLIPLSVSYLPHSSLTFILTHNFFVFIPNLLSDNSEFQTCPFTSHISCC